MFYNQVEIGARIKEVRKKRHYTQENMAEKLNISLEHFRAVESGRRSCSVDFLISISVIFGISLDYLLLGKTAPPEIEQIKREIQDIVIRLNELQMIM
ncbi:MAG: helix-turn-helix transcriptional regulator [Clostridiales bacterium]|nr:helix-turn-helix transcriptional regulator [Clostridiales bacterium]